MQMQEQIANKLVEKLKNKIGAQFGDNIMQAL
jgi:hypothetical protein